MAFIGMMAFFKTYCRKEGQKTEKETENWGRSGGFLPINRPKWGENAGKVLTKRKIGCIIYW